MIYSTEELLILQDFAKKSKGYNSCQGAFDCDTCPIGSREREGIPTRNQLHSLPNFEKNDNYSYCKDILHTISKYKVSSFMDKHNKGLEQ